MILTLLRTLLCHPPALSQATLFLLQLLDLLVDGQALRTDFVVCNDLLGSSSALLDTTFLCLRNDIPVVGEDVCVFGLFDPVFHDFIELVNPDAE